MKPSRQTTILIVEDNELNMKLFNDLLEARGYRVVQTMSGHEVLRLARDYNATTVDKSQRCVARALLFLLLVVL
jgi:CheY-like chemotaxis protein